MNLIDTTELGAEAAQLLTSGTPGNPSAGDLWVLSWNGQDLGLVVLGVPQDTYFAGVPVTVGSSTACMGSAVVPADHSPLTVDLTVWAAFPNSIGMHLLDRRLGRLCSGKELRRMVQAAAGEDIDSPYPSIHRAPSPEVEPFIEGLVQAFAEFADHDWVSAEPGAAPFDQDRLRGCGLDAYGLSKLLGVAVSQTFPLLAGERFPTAEQVSAVGEFTHLAPSEMLGRVSGAEVGAICHPRFKQALNKLARAHGWGEQQTRNRVLKDAYELAARQQRGDAIEEAADRVTDAIDRLAGP